MADVQRTPRELLEARGELAEDIVAVLVNGAIVENVCWIRCMMMPATNTPTRRSSSGPGAPPALGPPRLPSVNPHANTPPEPVIGSTMQAAIVLPPTSAQIFSSSSA